MNREKIIKQYHEIIESGRISMFQELVVFLNGELGDSIYSDLKNNNNDWFNALGGLALNFPKETFYVFQQYYSYFTKKQLENNEYIQLATLNFYIGDSLYHQNKSGYGKYYLKAYVEDIGFHGDYLRGGAIDALRVFCYLGQNGIDFLNNLLMQVTNTNSMETLRDHIKKNTNTRSEFERLIVEIENQFSLEGNENFLLPLSSLKEITSKIDPLIKKKGNPAKAKLLEQLCQLLFGSITGFRYKLDDRSKLFQLDGLIQNNSEHPFIKELGSTIVVEAKQYFEKSRIDRKIIDILVMNMTRMNATSAFIVTTAVLTKPAKEEIYHNYLRTGAFIIHLTYDEIKDLCEEKIFFPSLISSKVSNLRLKRK